MPKFVIERRIPRAGILAEMGSQVQWVQSYVTDNALLRTYIA